MVKVHKSVDPRNAKEPDTLLRALQLHQQGQLNEAAALYMYLDETYKPHHHARYLAAMIAREAGRYAEGIALLQDVVLHKPRWAEAWYNLGTMLQERGDVVTAEKHFRRALAEDRTFCSAHINLGNVLLATGRIDDARWHWQRAIDLNPDGHEARTNLAHALILQGDWPTGWKEYEHRWGTPGFAANNGFRGPAAKSWAGEPLNGAHIVLFCEQGAGDTIMCLRYRDSVIARGASHISWVVQPGLVRLVEANFPDDTILRDGDTPDRLDYICPLLSLPLHCGTTVDAVPGSRGYLTVGGEEDADTGRDAPVARGTVLGGITRAQE